MSEQPSGDPAAATAATAADGGTDNEVPLAVRSEMDSEMHSEPADEMGSPDVDVVLDEPVQDDTLEAEPPRTEVTPTGDQRVDLALARLPELDQLATAEHVAVYEEVHRTLQEALGAAGSGAGAPGGPRPAVPGPPRR